MNLNPDGQNWHCSNISCKEKFCDQCKNGDLNVGFSEVDIYVRTCLLSTNDDALSTQWYVSTVATSSVYLSFLSLLL
jgi:hypothetical protein